nr:hypothetical protein [Tanacetum cinerariifolium]
MATPVTTISSDSSEESVRTSTAWVILFGRIPTAIPATVPVVDPPVISTLPHTSLFLYTDSFNSDTPERSLSHDLYEVTIAQWRSQVASRSSPPSSPTDMTLPIRQILPAPPSLPHRPAVLVLPGQPIPIGQPYRAQPNEVRKMLKVRKRVRGLPVGRLASRYPPNHSSSDHFLSDDSSSDSPSNSLSGYSSDTSSRHSIPDSPFGTSVAISARPSRKRCRSSNTSVPIVTLVSGALSAVHAELLPPHKRIRGGVSEEANAEIQPVCTIDIRVDVATEIDIPDDLLMPDAIDQLGQLEKDRVGGRNLIADGERSSLLKRVVALESSNTGLRDALEPLTAQEANRNAGLIDENQSQNGDDNDNISGENGNHGNNNGDGNHNGRNEGVKRNAPVARVCTYKDFLNCQPRNFSGIKGVVSLARWFKKMKSVFRISNCPLNSQVKLATCTSLDGALTWWNSYVQTIGIDEAYEMPWKDLMKLMIEVYYPRNEIQKLENEL